MAGKKGLAPAEAGNVGLGITAVGGGLRPPNPNSVDPNGIPVRPAVEREPIMPGEEADATACDPEPSVVPAHGPEDIGMPEACGIEPPMPEHEVRLPMVEPSGSEIIGFTPGVPSSVAPSGIPMEPTAAPGPRPSGDVTPSGASGDVPIAPTWAKAHPQPRRVAATVAIHRRFILSLQVFRVPKAFGVPTLRRQAGRAAP